MLLYKRVGIFHIAVIVHLCCVVLTNNKVFSMVDIEKIINETNKYFDSIFDSIVDDFDGLGTIKDYFDNFGSFGNHSWASNGILDKYPDNYQNHTSVVTDVNGTKVVTNETIFKKTGNGRSFGIYIKHQTANGKTHTSSALKFSPKPSTPE